MIAINSGCLLTMLPKLNEVQISFIQQIWKLWENVYELPIIGAILQFFPLEERIKIVTIKRTFLKLLG